MGATLPKPVESTVVERRFSKRFRMGVAELNGWRPNMEDAHLAHIHDDWAFFGVFDGHGGEACSKYVAERLEAELSSGGCPADDAAVTELCLKVDQAFLDTQQDSGSTATMCIVHVPSSAGEKYKLRVVNIGDSRVLLGRRDGTIVDGGGTDSGLTKDHKPNEPSERERIYRCGGYVEEAQGGVARVNGSLAVSRGFGDADYKRTGGPGPEARPVTADPELGHFECDGADFLMLVCDGVSEGDFPNPDVVKFAADALREQDDPGVVARLVCHKALEMNSKDNISCMIVLLDGVDEPKESKEFIPGYIGSVEDKSFRKAYTEMARRAGLTLAQAGERRYELIEKELVSEGLSADRADELRDELAKMGNPSGAQGSEERRVHFEEWAKKVEDSEDTGNDGGLGNSAVLSMLMSTPGGQQRLMDIIGGGGASVLPAQDDATRGRRVRAPDLPALKQAVNGHYALKWDPRMEALASAEGYVTTDDPEDGTSKVVFAAPVNLETWLPTDALTDLV
eukprot:TRINITY_DN6881_c0_g1_i2.p1 TRINITY_DN6881_c0_g1~~TRINITY_DN6881_c0_g1_i2.p1  ORF type:complete len:510 (-),score=115.05 TRINITY_DN6881_c0_g1_i2:1047-2576(-)